MKKTLKSDINLFFRPAGRVKYLDLDSVYLKPLVDRSIGEVGACMQHADCDIFDCRGECDLVRGKCRSAVVNNNLQVRQCRVAHLGCRVDQKGEA
jgi:hypothetical protein